MSVVQYLSGDLTRSERKRKSRGADPPPYPIVGCCGYQATPNGHSCVSRCRRSGKVSTNNTAAKIVVRLLEIDGDRRMLCCGSSGTVNAYLAVWCICRHGCAHRNIPVGTTGVLWPLETRFGVLTFSVGPGSVTSRRWGESLRYETRPSQLRWAHRPKSPTPQAVAGLADIVRKMYGRYGKLGMKGHFDQPRVPLRPTIETYDSDARANQHLRMERKYGLMKVCKPCEFAKARHALQRSRYC